MDLPIKSQNPIVLDSESKTTQNLRIEKTDYLAFIGNFIILFKDYS